jgi:hypothetical protein
MSGRVQWLDDLGAEFARVADEHETARRTVHGRARRWLPRRRALATALSAIALLGAGGYAVPVTRAAMEDLTSSFTGWLSGDQSQAPGRALRPQDDAPDWVQSEGGRLIAERDGVRLYVSQAHTQMGTLLRFTLADGSVVFDTPSGWRQRFDQHAVVVLGTAPIASGKPVNDHGRFPMLGVTARSVTHVRLTYADGPPLDQDGINGGFVLLADAQRLPRELIAYDAAGHELDRADVRQFGPAADSNASR